MPYQQIVDRLPAMHVAEISVSDKSETTVYLPVEAFAALLRKYTLVKDVVVDLQPGVGTLLEASIRCNRQIVAVVRGDPVNQAASLQAQNRIAALLKDSKALKLLPDIRTPPTSDEIVEHQNRMKKVARKTNSDDDDDDETIEKFVDEDKKILDSAASNNPPFLCPPGFSSFTSDEEFLGQSLGESGLVIKKSTIPKAGKGYMYKFDINLSFLMLTLLLFADCLLLKNLTKGI